MSQSEANVAGKSPYVHALDGMRSLDNLLHVHGRALLSIFHPLVPRCQKFFPVFAEIAEALFASESEIKCVEVTSVGNADIFSKFGAKSYPTVVLCRASGNFKLYYGALRKEAILSWLERQNMPAVIYGISLESFQEIREAGHIVVTAYLGSDDGLVQEWFVAIAEELRDDFVFCTSNDDRLFTDEEASKPAIAVTTAERRSTFRDFPSKEHIRDFVQAAVRPLVMEFLPELYDDLLEKGILLGYIFISSRTQRQQAIHDFVTLARKFQVQIQFGTVDAYDFPDLAEDMHVRVDGPWPAFAIHHPGPNLKYPFSNSNSAGRPEAPDVSRLKQDEVAHFVQDFLDGKLSPTVKSAPIPNVQTSPVIEVVGFSYKDQVLDARKDVLVEFYTQWCTPCKALLPEYEKLASLYASDANTRDLVLVAKIDYEANDVPDKDIKGFPWFKLYPAGKKETPITYAGERRVASWADFIAKKGTHGVMFGPTTIPITTCNGP